MFMSGRPDGSGAGMPKKLSDSKDSRPGDAPGVQWEGHDVSSEDEDEHGLDIESRHEACRHSSFHSNRRCLSEDNSRKRIAVRH